MNVQSCLIGGLLLAGLPFPFSNTTAYMAAAPSNISKTIEAVTTHQDMQQIYSLDFDENNGYTEESMTINGQTVKFRAYRNIVYVANPKSVASQSMNIFIPSAYFEGGEINGYTKETAPIFMPNGVGGYMPGKAEEPKEKDPMGNGANAALTALSKGYVVAAPPSVMTARLM